MSITWKKKFKPDLVLQKIARTRTVGPDGQVSFSGSGYHEHLPILASMLEFPDAAVRINKGSLIWSALVHAQGDLHKSSFATAINQALKKELSTEIKRYVLVTSLSIRPRNIPRSLRVLGASIEFLPNGIPKNFSQRQAAIKANRLLIEEAPANYLPVRIAVRDKSPTAAVQHAIDHLDLFRGLIALYVNFAMQWSFGGSASHEPINRVRCGSRHTIHTPDGKLASEGIWFEPGFRAAEIYEVKSGAGLFEAIRRDLRQIEKSPYRKELSNALIKYARAFDEADQNTAFVKLWSAMEAITTPGVADYDALIKRCRFMYANGDYHQQVLEHLRDYRNKSIHSGVEGDDARTNCFLLQDYFRTVVHFYKGNHQAFSSLTDANAFLELPSDRAVLDAQLKALRKAIKFRAPG